jgi:hypothetical protein
VKASPECSHCFRAGHVKRLCPRRGESSAKILEEMQTNGKRRTEAIGAIADALLAFPAEEWPDAVLWAVEQIGMRRHSDVSEENRQRRRTMLQRLAALPGKCEEERRLERLA